MEITIETNIKAPIEDVWKAWTNPSDITKWNFAIDEWCCPSAEIDLSEGGNFSYRMEAKDGTMGFDFKGKFVEVIPKNCIRFLLEDDREVSIKFVDSGDFVTVTEIFEAEDENSAEQQRQGWQNILNNFKKHVEGGSN
jgi:uncharacterized protein YndB with AHSA1/START domain